MDGKHLVTVLYISSFEICPSFPAVLSLPSSLMAQSPFLLSLEPQSEGQGIFGAVRGASLFSIPPRPATRQPSGFPSQTPSLLIFP